MIDYPVFPHNFNVIQSTKRSINYIHQKKTSLLLQWLGWSIINSIKIRIYYKRANGELDAMRESK